MYQKQTVEYYPAVKPGIGQMLVATSPIVAASRVINQRKMHMNGVQGWSDEGGWAMLGVIAVGVIAVTGALCYQAGKAMAPNRSEANTWGWVGVPVGMLTGPWGLGVMGIISNSQRKG